MWPWTDGKLRRALRRYRRERDLEAVLQMDWHRDLDLSAFFTDVEERLHGEEITRLRQKQAEYLALQNQINATSQQLGAPLDLAQAQQFGIDAQVRQNLVTTYALDNEAKRIGLSVGDARVAQAIAALTGLGYTGSEAAQAIARLDPSLPVQDLIRLALQGIGKGR